MVFLILLLMTDTVTAVDAFREAQKALELMKKNPCMERAEKEVSSLFPSRKKSAKGKYILVISSSIPVHTLRAYARDALSLRKEGVHVAFVLRGCVNGCRYLSPTIRFYLSFASSKPHVYLNIDPAATEGVKRVPALMKGDCIVYGDAPLSCLIEAVEEGRCGETLGTTYAFREKSAFEEIASLSFKADREKIKEALLNRYRFFSCNIPHAEKNRVYSVKPEYSLPFNISVSGRVIYPEGFTFNPLSYVHLDGSILIVNAQRKDEKKLLPSLLKIAPEPVRVLIASGDYFELVKKYSGRNVQIYADCEAIDKLRALYGVCSGTPCIIWQEGDSFRVREVAQLHTQSHP